MLPETNRDEANHLIQRLRKRVQEILKVDITAGLASFPNEEITIFGLMETSSMDVLPDDFEPTASQEADILMEAV